MRNLSHCKHSRISAVSVALVLIATVQLPNFAGLPTPVRKPIPAPTFDPLYRLEQQGQGGKPKVYFGERDAWVAKYQVGSSGGRKLLWKKQLGTSGFDQSNGIARDRNGNVFITGVTNGVLGNTSQGFYDAWLSKYNPDGTLAWIQQLGTPKYDESNGVATDSDGNVFITGVTVGSLGGTSQGIEDAWLAKYSANGTLIWKRQLGTSRDDYSRGVATDRNGNVFISGTTNGTLGGTHKGFEDAWLAKYGPDGNLKWKRQLGTSAGDVSSAVATDSSGNVFITGLTGGDLGGTNKGFYDAWVAKYGPNGTLAWTKLIGTSDFDRSFGIATDLKGNVLITGVTSGSLGGPNKGSYDAWVAEYNSNGILKWKRQLGTSSGESTRDVATDRNGNVFITGLTDGSLGGTNKGGADAWAVKLDPQGKQLWQVQDGTKKDDIATGIAVDSSVYVIITGYTDGNFARD
ncbi:MAG TPA: SBBP repeat-containing protein [Stenomitos sp.]